MSDLNLQQDAIIKVLEDPDTNRLCPICKMLIPKGASLCPKCFRKIQKFKQNLSLEYPCISSYVIQLIDVIEFGHYEMYDVHSPVVLMTFIPLLTITFEDVRRLQYPR